MGAYDAIASEAPGCVRTWQSLRGLMTRSSSPLSSPARRQSYLPFEEMGRVAVSTCWTSWRASSAQTAERTPHSCQADLHPLC